MLLVVSFDLLLPWPLTSTCTTEYWLPEAQVQLALRKLFTQGSQDETDPSTNSNTCAPQKVVQSAPATQHSPPLHLPITTVHLRLYRCILATLHFVVFEILDHHHATSVHCFCVCTTAPPYHHFCSRTRLRPVMPNFKKRSLAV